MGFDIDVLEANSERLALIAEGPVASTCATTASDAGRERDRRAIVLRRKLGLRGRLIESVGRSLLRAGLLDRTVQKIAIAAAA